MDQAVEIRPTDELLKVLRATQQQEPPSAEHAPKAQVPGKKSFRARRGKQRGPEARSDTEKSFRARRGKQRRPEAAATPTEPNQNWLRLFRFGDLSLQTSNVTEAS